MAFGDLARAIPAFAAVIVMALPAQAAEPSGWTLAKGAPPAISLDDTLFAGKPVSRTAYIHVNGSRSEWVRSGALALAAPNLTFMISQRADPKPAVKTVIGSLEELNEISTAFRNYQPTYYAMTTAYGELRGVTFDVNADGIRKFCVGFHNPEAVAIYVKGYVCAADQTQATPQVVSCLIDKIRYSAMPPVDPAAPSPPACGAVRLDPNSSTANAPAQADRL